MHRPALLSVLVLIAPAAARAQQTPHDSVRGAVRAIDPRTRTLEITTGVGLALRVVRLQVPAAVPVTAPTGALALGDLKPGDVVRATFGVRTGGFVAYTIERVGRMGDGPGRTP